MKDTIKSPSIDTGIDITKMHGHMDIYLTDVKTGKVEEVHEDNMMTNALQEYFRNCGFLNYPNVNQSNMVHQLLGGIMAFDGEISESTSIVRVPTGLKMIANGSVETVNNSAVLELGSYSTTESGWQNDGSYVQTYDYTTSQANGTIACVCLTGNIYGYAGEGNTVSNAWDASRRVSPTDIGGNQTIYSGISGFVFGVDIANSVCCSFEIVTREVESGGEVTTIKVGVLRKYRIPTTKINIKGTQTEPIILDEQDITLGETLDNTSTHLFYQPWDGKLLMWDYPVTPDSSTWYYWGTDFEQHLWTLTTSGSLTMQTVINATGESNIIGMGPAIFDGNYCFIPKVHRLVEGANRIYVDTKTVYVWNRSNNSMQAISNATNGWNAACGSPNIPQWDRRIDCGWGLLRGNGNGRITTFTGSYQSTNYAPSCIYDANTLTASPTNIIKYIDYDRFETSSPLIRHNGMRLFRDQCYIASINNLDTPVVKTAEKTMKIVYRITFDEQ